jgi:hypothetical protein
MVMIVLVKDANMSTPSNENRIEDPRNWETYCQDHALVPDSVDSIPEDAWINGYFEAMQLAEKFWQSKLSSIVEALEK